MGTISKEIAKDIIDGRSSFKPIYDFPSNGVIQ